jgi:hypothetical protein
MTRKQIEKMIIAVLAVADYDISKAYQVETAEEPETVEENMNVLVEIVEEHLNKAAKKVKK